MVSRHESRNATNKCIYIHSRARILLCLALAIIDTCRRMCRERNNGVTALAAVLQAFVIFHANEYSYVCWANEDGETYMYDCSRDFFFFEN